MMPLGPIILNGVALKPNVSSEGKEANFNQLLLIKLQH